MSDIIYLLRFESMHIYRYFIKRSRLRSSRGACAEALREGGGRLEYRSHLIHSLVRLSPVLRRKRRKSLRSDSQR